MKEKNYIIQIKTEPIDSEFSCDVDEVYYTHRAYNYHTIV
jgi:hypothetical protein